MRLRLVEDGSGEPIANGTVLAKHDFADIELRSNDAGDVDLHFPDGITFLELSAKAPRHSTMIQRWNYEIGGLKLPPEFVFPMLTGAKIGGVVINDRGDPIGDVTLRIHCWLSPAEPRVLIRDHEVRTSADGRWACDLIPAGATWVAFSVRHPDYVQLDYSTNTDESGNALERYRRLEGVNVLSKGISVWGRVVTGMGEPVHGAEVQVGPFSDGYTRPIATTDENGMFRFTTERDDLAVMVRADHFSPQMLRLPHDQIESPIDVSLKPGGLIQGRVFDGAGGPIGGAELRVMWAGSSQDWRIRTDGDGVFVWDSAPLDGHIEVDIRKGGYITKRRFVVTPGNEYNVTLRDVLVIRGQVVDAKTRAPLRQFRVTPAFQQDPEMALFHATSSAVEGVDGAFAIAINSEHEGVYLVVEADGHLPVKSRRFAFDEGERAWNAALEVGDGPGALVKDMNGAAVAGASVHRTTQSACEVIDGERFYGNSTEETTTDEFGSFGFTAGFDPSAIIVVTEQGYVVATDGELQAQDVIHLQSWSRLEGRYLVGDVPGAEQHIEMVSFANRYDDQPGFLFRSQVTTDLDGQFAFERVPAGLVEIKHLLSKRSRQGVTVQRDVLDLKPGETRVVQLGGRGRPVIGHVAPPSGLVATSSWTYAGYASLRTGDFSWPYPQEYATWTDEEQQRWWHAWRKTDECAALLERRFREDREYHFDIAPDGTVRIEDVLPGSYSLYVRIDDPDSLLTGGFGDPLGVLDKEVRIPETDPQSPRELFDLGLLELALSTKVKIGATAPDFEFATVDGENLRLSDFRGKYVLLDFWATWCAPCVEELTHINAIYDQYHQKGLEVIGLSLDFGPEAPAALFQRRGYNWVQGYLGKEEAVVTRRYGVLGIPSILLIDPEGRVLARDLRGRSIRDAVGTALETR